MVLSLSAYPSLIYLQLCIFLFLRLNLDGFWEKGKTHEGRVRLKRGDEEEDVFEGWKKGPAEAEGVPHGGC